MMTNSIVFDPYSLAPLGWSLQWPELVMIMFIALLIFGKRLPEVARSLGRGLSEFKAGLREIGNDVDLGEQAHAPSAQRPVTPLPPPEQPVARTAAPSPAEPVSAESTPSSEQARAQTATSNKTSGTQSAAS